MLSKIKPTAKFWRNWCNRRTTSLTGLTQLTQNVRRIFNHILDQLFIILHAVNAQYKAAKAESERLLAQARAVLEERDPGIVEETDRIISIRELYFKELAEWEDALEVVRGDEAELRRQGVEKPVFPENAQEDDLNSLEELEIACRTIQEQLEFNNNRDESVVRSYEEKKKLVSAWWFVSDKFGGFWIGT